MSFENIEPLLKDLKEWNRIYWLAKNRMMPSHWTHQEMQSAYDKYLPRVWNSFDGEDTTEDFKLAYEEHLRKLVVSHHYKIPKSIRMVHSKML